MTEKHIFAYGVCYLKLQTSKFWTDLVSMSSHRGRSIYPDLHCILCLLSDDFVIPQQKIVSLL